MELSFALQNKIARALSEPQRVRHIAKAVVVYQGAGNVVIEVNPDSAMIDNVTVDDHVMRGDVSRLVLRHSVAEHDHNAMAEG